MIDVLCGKISLRVQGFDGEKLRDLKKWLREHERLVGCGQTKASKGE